MVTQGELIDPTYVIPYVYIVSLTVIVIRFLAHLKLSWFWGYYS